MPVEDSLCSVCHTDITPFRPRSEFPTHYDSLVEALGEAGLMFEDIRSVEFLPDRKVYLANPEFFQPHETSEIYSGQDAAYFLKSARVDNRPIGSMHTHPEDVRQWTAYLTNGRAFGLMHVLGGIQAEFDWYEIREGEADTIDETDPFD